MFSVAESNNMQTLPLNERNIVMFVNNFLTTSTNFLNEFLIQCETKFIKFERKMQKIEASLVILESKLKSIPNQAVEKSPEYVPLELRTANATSLTENGNNENICVSKYLKMLQFGMPTEAIRTQILADGLNPEIMEKYYSKHPTTNDNYSEF